MSKVIINLTTEPVTERAGFIYAARLRKPLASVDQEGNIEPVLGESVLMSKQDRLNFSTTIATNLFRQITEQNALTFSDRVYALLYKNGYSFVRNPRDQS